MVDAILEDYQQAPLSEAEQVMLAYAVKLTLEPSSMIRGDVESLRQVGWSDEAILDIAQITAHFAFANRLVDGLGVELEDIWRQAESV